VVAIHQALLVAAACALLATGFRIASLAAPGGAERALAAIAVAAGLAVAETLGLGLVGLGGSAAALVVAAAATWLLSLRLLPNPAVAPAAELRARMARLGGGPAVTLGAVAGGWLAWATNEVAEPAPHIDSVAYHTADVVAWIHGGSPGSVEAINGVFAVGSYPLTHEVLLTWIAGISRSLGVLHLSSPLMLALGAAAGWVALRRLDVGRPVAALAVAAVCLVPVAVDQVRGLSTDIPALAWLAVAGALVAVATRERRAGLLPFAVLAAGLAIGTKTTAALPALIVLAVGAHGCPGLLRDHGRALAIAALAAVLVGGLWYLRNLIDHGSPLWPFLALPWGDPQPPIYELLDGNFLGDPAGSVEGRGGEYLERLGGGLVVLAAALIAPLVVRRRAVALAGAATAALCVVWACAPFTAVTDDPAYAGLLLSTTRYLLPAVAAGAVTLALASRSARAGRALAAGAFVVAIGLSLGYDVRVDAVSGLRLLPFAAILAGAALGAGAALLARELAGRRPAPGRAGRAALGAAAALALVATLTVATNGFLDRYSSSRAQFAALVDWFGAQPEFDDEGRSISFWREQTALLAGERLQHELSLIDPGASCEAVESRLDSGWVVVRSVPGTVEPPAAARCVDGLRPLLDDPGSGFRVYGSG
jgi:hypothetical protein